jgi:hypothetical protein
MDGRGFSFSSQMQGAGCRATPPLELPVSSDIGNTPNFVFWEFRFSALASLQHSNLHY